MTAIIATILHYTPPATDGEYQHGSRAIQRRHSGGGGADIIENAGLKKEQPASFA
jgi:hypothetical protein